MIDGDGEDDGIGVWFVSNTGRRMMVMCFIKVRREGTKG